MNGKKWVTIWLILAGMTVSITAVINYVINPNWEFSHVNKLQGKQEYHDERQQKTNYIYVNGLKDYDGILLGSSRATYINQYDFLNMNIYNYAVRALRPYEYEKYINFAKKVKGHGFKYIIIGSDFYGTNALKGTENFKLPSFYIAATTSPFNKYKQLISLDTLKFSCHNIKNNFFGASSFYTRNNIKHHVKVSEEERLKGYTYNIKRHTLNLSGQKYLYDNKYIQYLKTIKRENPNTKFIIYTSPITADLLVSIIKNGGRFNEFERWLKDLISVFGEVHHFMKISDFTTNLDNYKDSDHAYPDMASLVATKISGGRSLNIPYNFETILNTNNVDSFLKKFKGKVDVYYKPEFKSLYSTPISQTVF